MARNKHKAEDETECFEVHAIFRTKEDADAFMELAEGMADHVRFLDRKKVVYSKTILGALILKVFEVPNRTYDIETIQAVVCELGYVAKSVQTYTYELCKEGLIYKVGTSWARRYTDDTASPVRSDVDVDAACDGHPAGLEQGEAHLN